MKYDIKWIQDNSNNGVITSNYISKNGVHRSVLGNMVRDGELVQYSRGIYVLADEWEDEFYLLQLKYKKGIYSHTTALYLHGYSERVPSFFHMVFPTNYNSKSLKYEAVKITRVIKENYELGKTYAYTPSGNRVSVYDIERCLCDIVRGKGEDTQEILYAMKKYASSKNKDINKLMRYAKQLHVERKIQRYMEVLL